MFDTDLFLAINGSVPAPLRTALVGVTYLASVPAVAFWFALIVWWTRTDGLVVARKIGVALALAAGADLLLKAVFGRLRPWRVLPAHVAGPLESDFSFPSGHATLAFAIAASTALTFPRLRWPVLMMASLVAFSRIAIGMHYPGDVIAGAALGGGCALLVHGLVGRRGTDPTTAREPRT